MTASRPQKASLAVVVPVWNGGLTIARALNSILSEKLSDVDVVVVNDGSTDDTLDTLAAFSERIRVFSQPNSGACVARNSGLENVKSEWVLFLDSDDYIESGFLHSMLGQASALNVDLVIGKVKVLREDGPVTFQGYPEGCRGEPLLLSWLRGNVVQTGAQLWRTSFLKQIGGWNTSVLMNQEIELVSRAILLGARAQTVDIGHAVWVDDARPGRISRRSDNAAVESSFSYLFALSRLSEFASGEVRYEFGRQLYEIAKTAFARDINSLAIDALSESRKMGFEGHTGSFLEKCVARTLGLERTQLLRRCLQPVKFWVGKALESRTTLSGGSCHGG